VLESESIMRSCAEISAPARGTTSTHAQEIAMIPLFFGLQFSWQRTAAPKLIREARATVPKAS